MMTDKQEVMEMNATRCNCHRVRHVCVSWAPGWCLASTTWHARIHGVS